MKEKKRKKVESKTKNIAPAGKQKTKTETAEPKCNDKSCHIHGNLKTRGRFFEGKVKKKFQKRVVIEFERLIYLRKYERYKKSKTKIHARLTPCMEKQINLGDIVRVQETRPLSKIIHAVVISKVKEGVNKK